MVAFLELGMFSLMRFGRLRKATIFSYLYVQIRFRVP